MRLFVAAAGLAATVGCGPDRTDLSFQPLDPVDEPADGPTPPPLPPPDSDADGLTDERERELGTDPTRPDTDGDGWTDLEESEIENTDPTDALDRPYLGGWPIAACRDDVQGTGQGIGQTAHDFALVDQFGDTLHLHDFCDRAVLLVTSADWCGSCQSEAPVLEAWYDAWADDGFLVITLLGEGAPSAWAEAFGLHHPVVQDPGYGVSTRFVGGGSFYLPSMHLLGPGLVVITAEDLVSESEVAAALP